MTIQSVTVAITAGTMYETVTVSFGTPLTTQTMGETSILSIADSGNGNLLLAQQAILEQTGILQSLSFYVTVAAGKLRLGLYDATGPSGGPGVLIVAAPEITPIIGWNTVAVSPVNLASGTYWLAYLPSSNNLGFRNGPGGGRQLRAFTYGALPSIFSSSPLLTSPDHWSFYAILSATQVIPPPVYAGPFNTSGPLPPGSPGGRTLPFK